MKPHPRIRKALKWTGAAITPVFVVVFLLGPWWTFSCDSPRGVFAWVGSGSLSFGYSGTQREKWLMVLDRAWLSSYTKWWFNVSYRPALPPGHKDAPFTYLVAPGTPVPGTRANWRVDIPLWVPALLSMAITIAAWRADATARHRARTGACAACGYDRSGMAAGAACPECGAAAAKV